MSLTGRAVSKADVVNLGSTYAFYDFIYDGLSIRGVNLASRPQYLDVDLMLVKKYGNKMNGAKVIVVLPDFVFAADAEKMSKQNNAVLLRFYPWEVKWFSVSGYVKAIYRAVKGKLKSAAKRILRPVLKKHISPSNASVAEKQRAAEARTESWENALGIPSMNSGVVPPEIQRHIEENIQRLNEIIRLLKKAGAEPYIVVPPVSEILNGIVTEECMQKYLFEPISEREDKSVPVLNFLYAPEYQNADMYLNADCLNAESARLFTRELCRKIGLI